MVFIFRIGIRQPASLMDFVTDENIHCIKIASAKFMFSAEQVHSQPSASLWSQDTKGATMPLTDWYFGRWEREKHGVKRSLGIQQFQYYYSSHKTYFPRLYVWCLTRRATTGNTDLERWQEVVSPRSTLLTFQKTLWKWFRSNTMCIQICQLFIEPISVFTSIIPVTFIKINH